jgi:acetyl-CoA C-acetyltransferase
MKKIKIKSTYMTEFGNLQEDFLDLVLKAACNILSANDPGQVSRIYFSSFAPGALCAIEDPLRAVSDALKGAFPSLKAKFYGPYKTGGEAFVECLENFDGNRGDALVLGCEKMSHLETRASSGILAQTVNPHDRSYGATLPALGALVTRLYQNMYSIPFHAFHAVSVKNHGNALFNPKAHFRKKVTMDEVAASPMVSDPLRRLHCAPTSDGAAGVLLGCAGGNITVSGWGKGADMPLFHERKRIERFQATAKAAKSALASTNITRDEINVVEIHDAFCPFELINLEEMGFYPPGASWRALLEGELDINGKIAVNPSGGMKARGHPIGTCGLASLIEVYEQLTFAAGSRQHRNANAGMIQSAGGVSNRSYIFILNE